MQLIKFTPAPESAPIARTPRKGFSLFKVGAEETSDEVGGVGGGFSSGFGQGLGIGAGLLAFGVAYSFLKSRRS